MALASYSGNQVPLNYTDHDQLFWEPGFHPDDVASFACPPLLTGSLEVEEYSCCLNDVSGAAVTLTCDGPGLLGNYVFATDGLECLYPKRQRTVGPGQFPEFTPLQSPQVPELFPFPNEYGCFSMGWDCESGSVSKRKSGGRPSLSVQSMAARERRRKITEKTTELGKLVPGGRKMTTAEMLQAAHKYIRFLQAQVGMLQLVHLDIDEVNSGVQQCQSLSNIGALLGSQRIQEKLYAEEKCLATNELVRSIAKNEVNMVRARKSSSTALD